MTFGRLCEPQGKVTKLVGYAAVAYGGAHDLQNSTGDTRGHIQVGSLEVGILHTAPTRAPISPLVLMGVSWSLIHDCYPGHGLNFVGVCPAPAAPRLQKLGQQLQDSQAQFLEGCAGGREDAQ